MKYVHEFKIVPDQIDNAELIEYRKKNGGSELGVMIADKVGYCKDGERFALDVEVFSRKQWQEFKDELRGYIDAASSINLSTFNLVVVGKMIKKLESEEIQKL